MYSTAQGTCLLVHGKLSYAGLSVRPFLPLASDGSAVSNTVSVRYIYHKRESFVLTFYGPFSIASHVAVAIVNLQVVQLVQRMADQLPSNKLQVVFLINNYHEVSVATADDLPLPQLDRKEGVCC